ncbi:glycosyl hydrolase family 28 protein [Nonomuraea sp. NPDC052116]|uniref:glycosyl hydrolase family 28 protein n=1 Tax=Nonomuraea sp. NPDC052116 TaxID=3155665 RepID=UPI003423A512
MTISRRDLIRAGGVLLVGTGTTGGPAYAESVAPGAAGSATMATATATATPTAASPWDRVPEILARIVPPAFPDRTFTITDYGAKPDNSTDCTAAFRDAVAACNAAGGGRVVVPPGTFRTGKIHLLSNVNLQVNGTIRFRTDPGSYLPTVLTRWEGIECYNYSPFIYANGQTNVAITGTGTIDGNAPAGDWSSWGSGGADRDQLRSWGADDHPVAQRQFGSGHKLRPNMIGLYNCTAVLVEGVNLRNPAMWTLHPVYCTNVTVRNVTFYSTNSQGDGCDPDSCTDVLITGCKFDTNDDCVPIKSGRDRDGRRVNRPSQNIVIQNCKFSGRWGGVTIGSEMSGGVRDVFAEDCECNAPDFPGRYPVKYALYVKTSFNRGGFVDGVHLRRITGHDLERSALYVTLNYETSGALPPVVQNFTADGLTIDGAAQAYDLDGRPTDHIKNVTISNSTFTGITTATPTASNVDNLVLSRVSVNGKDISNTQPPAGTRYEAEDAVIFQGAAESNHAGYSGTGFVNTDNVAGAYVEFAVSAATAGSRSLTIRYANGTSTNRPFAVTVNGTAAGSAVNAPGTGAWTTWVSTPVTVPLAPGTNAVRLTATTAGGLPNLDYVELQP